MSFGISHIIISDNRPQFSNSVGTDWYKELGIEHLTSTSKYPQGNDQAEASNKTILNCLVRRLKAKKGKWPEELLGVLMSKPKPPTSNKMILF